MEEKPPCEICEHFKDKKGVSPACNECLPELLPENHLPWKIYSLVAGQLISLGDTPIDIDILAVDRILSIYGIQDKQEILERIIGLSRHMIKRWNEKRKQEMKKHQKIFPRARR